MNKKYVVWLCEEERATLLGLIRVGKAEARKLMRARILLKVDQGEGGPGWTDEQTAEALEVGLSTIANVRQRFVEEGLEAAIQRRKQVRRLRSLELKAREAEAHVQRVLLQHPGRSWETSDLVRAVLEGLPFPG